VGIAERKERDKQEMRERILDVATQMFLEDGYEKTSIRNIAEKIEYSPATIYLYFKDKDELFFAIHEIGFGKLLTAMQKCNSIKNPLKRLREMGAVYIDFALQNPEYYDLMFILRAPMNAIKEKHAEEQCWQCGMNTFGLLMNTVNECIEQKAITVTNPMIAGMLTWSTVHGLVSLHIRDRYTVMDMKEDQIREMIMASLDEMIKQIKA
jgi:AcrR family transcriptional regulator